MQANLRYWEYYNMTDTFTNLFEKSKKGSSFDNLYDIVISRENILLAYRTIKGNKGSKTAGTDGRTIEDIKQLTEEDLIIKVRNILNNYRPKKVKRVMIPKPNGGTRPLGIPCIMDRIIQQCFKQVLEPICEAKFFNHSYGFRPLRSTHHAVSRLKSLINHSKLHYVVDIDIKGFFDNVNHSKLMKQMWNIGIRDRKVLTIVMKMLKSEIDGEGLPSKGTPQGGILSPLLSNIVLNDLDQWVSSQWECMKTDNTYSRNDSKFRALKKTNLKEGFIIRYADDFKIVCRDWKSAQKWYHAVKLYLKERLDLDINSSKSTITNLRKKKTDFLGFEISAKRKGDKFVATTSINSKKKKVVKNSVKDLIKKIKKSPTPENALKFNKYVLGSHNYYKYATQVSSEFSSLHYDLSKIMYNKFKLIGKFDVPDKPPPSYSKFYKNNYKTYNICGVWLYPIADIKTSHTLNYSQDISIFTEYGRNKITDTLSKDIGYQLKEMINYKDNSEYSIEYFDNKLSRYSMVKGKCELTGTFLTSKDVHCHHKIPKHMGGKDDYNNLIIIHKDIHRLVHATKKDTIEKYMKIFQLNGNQLNKLNQLRINCGLELISE